MYKVIADLSTELSGPILLLAPIMITMALVLINGVFVAAEFAIIGVRRTQMEQLAGDGNARASRVLLFSSHPSGKIDISPPLN